MGGVSYLDKMSSFGKAGFASIWVKIGEIDRGNATFGLGEPHGVIGIGLATIHRTGINAGGIKLGEAETLTEE